MSKYHYTYLIEVLEPTDSRKYYIGARSSDCYPTEDNYYGSSKYLKSWIKENGKHKLVKKILAIWPTREHAIEHEIRLHDEFNVALNEEYFNRSKQKTTGFDTSGMVSGWKGKSPSEETLEKMRLAAKSRVSPNKGTTLSEEQKKKISETKLKNPYKHTEEHKAKMRQRFKKKQTCPTCGKVGSGPVMYRHHFSNCKVI